MWQGKRGNPHLFLVPVRKFHEEQTTIITFFALGGTQQLQKNNVVTVDPIGCHRQQHRVID